MIAIELDLPQPRAYVWLWLIAMLLPVLVIGGLLLFGPEEVRTAPTALMGLLPVAAITAVLHGFMRRQRAWIEAGVLHIVTTFYHRHVPLSALNLDDARVHSLPNHPRWRPWLRSNGFAVPGMVSGWYRLPQWRKAFAAYGDPERVLCIDAGEFALLLGVAHPQSALDKLRRARGESAR